MSGVNRNISADLAKNGHHTEEELKRAFSPEAIRAERGTSNEDVREGYVGPNAHPISPSVPRA
jgi:hypothetical protein